MTLVTPADAKRPGAGDDDVRRTRHARRRVPPRRLPPARGLAAAARAWRAAAPAADPPATEQLIADGWGYASHQSRQHSGRQRRRPDQGHHRPRQQRPAAQARRLGRAARLGLGRVARSRLSRDRQGRGREAGRHRRRLALRQGGAGDDGVRPALRGGADRLVRRRRRQAAPPQLGRSGREPHRLRRISLDGRQLPEVRRRRKRPSAARPPATSRSTRTS